MTFNNLNVTYGYSKDHRPDLKQFLVKMLCVGRNVPILGRCEDGNTSDKTINNSVLSNISKHMAKFGLEPGAFIYVYGSYRYQGWWNMQVYVAAHRDSATLFNGFAFVGI